MSKFFDKFSLWISLGASVTFFLLVCGPSVLNPLNESWLLGGGDLTQQYFGWAFFRNSPWTMPLGLNPMYGMDISSSIVYSDGNPLLSLLFKIFNSFLPETFQFQGMWLLVCFVLQAYFAWKILNLYTNDPIVNALGATIFLFSTPMLFRVGVHTNLAAHFLILGGFYLNLRGWRKSQSIWWAALLLISLGIHFYLFAMIFALWIADLCDRKFSQNNLDLRSTFTSVGITLICIAICAWQFGYFTVKAPSLFGYGFFKANVLSLLNPNGWSLLIKDIPIKSSWGEGNLYLGLGALLLLALGLLQAGLSRNYEIDKLRPYKFLILILASLTLFSITNQIGIGALEFRIPLPQWLLQPFGILRHSARLFWPVYYSILIAACILIFQNFNKTYARIIFAFCLTIQIVDISPGLIKLHAELNAQIQNNVTSLPLRQSFWSLAGKHYKNVYLLPSRSEPNPDFMSRFMSSDWKVFGRYASLNQLNTNAVYLSRYDSQRQETAFSNSLELINTGLYDQSTLYIIKDEDLLPVALGLKNKNTLLAKIDGYNILAPELLGSADINMIGAYSKFDFNSIRPKLNQEISFKRPENPISSYALTKDWNNREDWGVWSRGKDMVLTLPLPLTPAQSVTLTLRAFVNGAIPKQALQVSSEGKLIGDFYLSKFEGNTIKVDIPDTAKQKGYISLDLKVPNAASPSSIGMDEDSRVLGIGIVSARFN